MSPFMTDLVPSDSGVYDNSALETAKERFQTVLVGDVSQKKQPEAEQRAVDRSRRPPAVRPFESPSQRGHNDSIPCNHRAGGLFGRR